MPAGKMVKYVPRRRYKKRASGFKKAVTTIAKRVVMRQTETREFDRTFQASIGSNGFFQGLWTSISRGDTAADRDGDVIKTLGMKWRGSLVVDPSVITAGQEDFIQTRIMLISSKRPLTSITDAGLSWNGGTDNEKINVHYDRMVSWDKQKRNLCLNKYLKYQRNVKYEPLTNSVIQGELYLVIIPRVVAGTPGMTATSGLYLDSIAQGYFKDP